MLLLCSSTPTWPNRADKIVDLLPLRLSCVQKGSQHQFQSAFVPTSSGKVKMHRGACAVDPVHCGGWRGLYGFLFHLVVFHLNVGFAQIQVLF